jgi:acyl CoA:acetate/3-ketoacid CoA transferase alpha subunit/acyl CoA:acetate/3-ketoacid CoA transferase beta subunit
LIVFRSFLPKERRVQITSMSKGPRDILKGESKPGREGGGKLMSLAEAVRRHIRPGMKVHLAAGIGGPSAAICELIRQFSGKDPAFTIIQSTVTGHALNLVHCGLVGRLICAACIDISTSARPSRIIQKALKEKQIELENWSLCSLQQRLMAGAFGFPFLPTRSITGSDIAPDNAEAFMEIADPFGSAAQTGIVKALNPDISIIHGCLGDVEGNIIPSAPYGDDLWGPLASTGGVLVTVEKIVPTEFIRKHAAFVKIPSYVVKSVSLAPLGAHPFGLPSPGISDFEPYAQDVPFLIGLHKAFSHEETLNAWIAEWVTSCPSHQEYLAKLGATTVAALQQKPKNATEGKAFTGSFSPAPSTQPFTGQEMMYIALAREIIRSVEEKGHKTILAGAGVGATAAWLAYYQLQDAGYEIELITGNGLIGYTPLPGESVLSSEAGVRSAKILTDTIMTHSVFVGGKNNKCLSVLGTGQIDRHGNINSTRTSTGQFLVGSGGANDSVNAQEVMVALNQSRDRFVDRLPFITGRGDGVTTVISTMALFRKPAPGHELTLCACFPATDGKSLSERIKEVEDACGWPLAQAAEIRELERPAEGELELLRWLLASSVE